MPKTAGRTTASAQVASIVNGVCIRAASRGCRSDRYNHQLPMRRLVGLDMAQVTGQRQDRLGAALGAHTLRHLAGQEENAMAKKPS